MLGILEITDKKDNSRTTYSIQSKPVILDEVLPAIPSLIRRKSLAVTA